MCAGNWGGGGGLNIFFRGRNAHQEKRVFFCYSEKGRGNSVNEGCGKGFYRKDNSVKMFGPFTEALDFEN